MCCLWNKSLTNFYCCCRFLFLLVFLDLMSPGSSYQAVRFTGGGIYFWWQAGVATYLLEDKNLKSTHLIGASAGSITASLLLAKADFQQAAKIAIRQVDEMKLWNNPTGLAGVWGPILEDFLQQLILPSSITDEDLKRIHIAATPRFIFKGTKFLNNFETKEELIHAVLTSTHIPFFMDGKPWKAYKGKKYIDGSFWSFVLNKTPKLTSSMFHRQLAAFHTSSEISGKHKQNPAAYQLFDEKSRDVKSQTQIDLLESSTSRQLYDLNSLPFQPSRNLVAEELDLEDSKEKRQLVTVLDIDFRKDEKLMKSMKGTHFVDLITPAKLYEMMELGYDYMRKNAENELNLQTFTSV